MTKTVRSEEELIKLWSKTITKRILRLRVKREHYKEKIKAGVLK